MSNWFAIPLAFLLLSDADVPRVNSLRPPAIPIVGFPSDQEIPLFPNAGASSDSAQGQTQSQSKATSGAKNTTLQENSKLALIRYVSGEFAKAVKPLPAGKEGLHVNVGKPQDSGLLDRAVATHGAAVNTGDKVQITKLEFRDHQIIVDLNGGGRGKRHWRDHLQIGLGGGYPTARTTSAQETGPPGLQPGMGSTIFLEWNKSVPDLAPDDLKQILSPFLNSAKKLSRPSAGPITRCASATPTATTSRIGFTASRLQKQSSCVSSATASQASSSSRNSLGASDQTVVRLLAKLRSSYCLAL